MLKRWRAEWRRRRRQHAAAAITDWLSSIDQVVTACREALQAQTAPGDHHLALNRIDARLERLRRAEGAVLRSLRRASPPLARRLGDAGDRAYQLRNLAVAFFIRSRAFEEVDDRGAPVSFMARREMDEALLAARRSLQDTAEIGAALAPDLEAWAWELSSASP